MTLPTPPQSRWRKPTRVAAPIDAGTARAEHGRESRRRDDRPEWGESRKACGAAMVCWALTGGPNQDIAAPSRTPEPAAHRSSGAVTATVETGTVGTATTPESRRAAHERLANARRNELNTVLDSMLITQRIEPGTPFEQRSGHIPDERIRNIVKKIDDRLGGRIEWPNINLIDGLRENANANGQYRAYREHRAYGGVDGGTAPRRVNDWLEPADKYGIRLDAQLVENELATGRPADISIESLLVHELQHATSDDHGTELRSMADVTGDALAALPYEDIADAATTMKPVYGGSPTAESRADLAMVLSRELEQREKLGGPKLNEMPHDERRAAMAGILMRYVENHHDRDKNKEPSRLRSTLEGRAAWRSTSTRPASGPTRTRAGGSRRTRWRNSTHPRDRRRSAGGSSTPSRRRAR